MEWLTHAWRRASLALMALMACLALGSALRPEPATVWQVVLVAATDEPSIGQGARQFLGYSSTAVARMSAKLGWKLELTVVQGRSLQPKRLGALLDSLERQPKGPERRILTWLSFTHGFNVPNGGEWPYLVAHPTKTLLSPQESRYALGLSDLYGRLRRSGAFAHVHVWAELCNHICQGCRQVPEEGLAGLSAGRAEGLGALLCQGPGSLMASSGRGQASCASTAGGPFSRALLEALSMAEQGEWRGPWEGPQGFFAIVEALAAVYLAELPDGACQTQRPLLLAGPALP